MTTNQRLSLAELIIMVNDWEIANAKDPRSDESKALISKLANKVKTFGEYGVLRYIHIL